MESEEVGNMDLTSRMVALLVAVTLVSLMMVIQSSPAGSEELYRRRIARRIPFVVMKKFEGLEKGLNIHVI